MRFGIIGKLSRASDNIIPTDVCRITIHNASWDYAGNYPRHGTRVTALAETPFFNANAPTRREALGLLGEDEKPVNGFLVD